MKYVIIFSVVLFLAGLTWLISLDYIYTEEVEFVVYQKYIKRGAGEDAVDRYMIVTPNEVFVNTDDIFRSKWNSSDVQAMFNPDSTTEYTAIATGKRIPIISKYRNLVNVKEKE